MTENWNSEQHWRNFKDFCKLEIGSGGPDPHCTMAAEFMKTLPDLADRIWIAGCYVGPYEINMASVIWTGWNWIDVLEYPEEFRKWIEATWPDWQIRRERRAARTVNKMHKSLVSYAQWTKRIAEQSLHTSSYDELWKDAEENLVYFGRYAIIKVLETLHRGGAITAPMHDIRPAGAWSPRKTLTWLYPNDPLLARGNTPEHLEAVNARVDMLITNLELSLGRKPTYFEVEVLLCNYRQVLDERNGRYAGWSLDMDLEHFNRISTLFGEVDFDFKSERSRLFPHEHLGELSGWNGVRKNLCGYRGYFWSDKLYDFMATVDYTNPVRRPRR